MFNSRNLKQQATTHSVVTNECAARKALSAAWSMDLSFPSVCPAEVGARRLCCACLLLPPEVAKESSRQIPGARMHEPLVHVLQREAEGALATGGAAVVAHPP